MSEPHLEPIADDLETALARLRDERAVERLWARDHTLWDPSPEEISNRLGWLEPEPPPDAEVHALAEEARSEGVADAVLLGMGGSSLGAEALRASFGARPGHPRLTVLDSTHPRWVERVRRAVDPAETLFLVASKSGTTAEVRALFDYFWAETEAASVDDPGRRFVAVTDPETPLVELARERGFRRVFTNPPDVGGRFSVLTRFGRVPAALMGIDTAKLVARARAMASRSMTGQVRENPGAWLGAVLAAGAAAGRDQLTLLTSPRVTAFGLWVEQLLAESTGKRGRGILPVTGEPAADPARYGDRRLFVALRHGPDPELRARVRALAGAGQPVVEYAVDELFDLGGELYRWEFATAVAGHLIGIHPFDQPDVESAKRETRAVLGAYEKSGRLPRAEAPSDLAAALREETPSYVALMAYADADEAFERAVGELRRALLERHGLTTTFGYGPRFLHSTGQLHKGGPPGGLFVQLLAGTGHDVPIPGAGYGFGLLIEAQAAGDLAALRAAGRRAVRLELEGDPAARLAALAAAIEDA